jgi:hypothetical protein
MKLNAKDRHILRSAAAVADAQQELVALQKNRREGRPTSARTAAPLLAVLIASMAALYFSAMAITSEQDVAQVPIFLSGDIEQPLPPG